MPDRLVLAKTNRHCNNQKYFAQKVVYQYWYYLRFPQRLHMIHQLSTKHGKQYINYRQKAAIYV